jgi:hypothetical protein
MNHDRARATSTTNGHSSRRGAVSELGGLSTAVQEHVEHELHARRAPKGTFAAKVEEKLKVRADQLWAAMKRHPSPGVVLTGALGFAIASAVGAGELLIAISAASAAYLVLRKNVSPVVAIEEAFGPR